MTDILIVGPGAVGGVLAARGARGGRRVRLLDRSAKDERAVARGLSYTARNGRTARLRRGLISARKTRKVRGKK